MSCIQQVRGGCTKVDDDSQHPRQVGEEFGPQSDDHLSNHVQEPLLLLEWNHTTEVGGQFTSY